LRRKLYYYII